MLRDTIPSTSGSSSISIKQNNSGVFLFYDTSRNKYLSSSRDSFSFGINNKNISSNRYLMITSGIYSNLSGYKTYRNSTITSLSIQTENLATCSFHIRKNNSSTNITTISLSNESGKVLDDLDENLDKDDYIQCFLEINVGNVDYPSLLVELAFRE